MYVPAFRPCFPPAELKANIHDSGPVKSVQLAVYFQFLRAIQGFILSLKINRKNCLSAGSVAWSTCWAGNWTPAQIETMKPYAMKIW